MKVWFVDDRADNRATWLASFPAAVRRACELSTFATVPELFAALDAGERPDVVFIDFFVGGHTGDEVVERFVRAAEVPPLLVAHSSVDRVNDGMVRAGAHLKMEKVRGASRTRSIVQEIRDVDDLQRLIATYRTR